MHASEFHEHLNACCDVLHEYIKERGKEGQAKGGDGWVRATDVNAGLNMNLSAAPKDSEQPSGHKGWLLATLARRLRVSGRLLVDKRGGRVFYKAIEL